MVKSLVGKRHDYYEGILQLRDVTPEFVDMVVQTIEGSGKCQIAKIDPEKGGVDIYVTDDHYVQSLGKTLQQKFGGEVKSSKKLFGRYKKTGKIVYRVTVLFRKLPWSVGDIVETEDGDVKVLDITSTVRVQYVSSGKKKTLRYDQLRRVVS